MMRHGQSVMHGSIPRLLQGTNVELRQNHTRLVESCQTGHARTGRVMPGLVNPGSGHEVIRDLRTLEIHDEP